MKNSIHILKGNYGKIRISNCVFKLLKPLEISNGKITATVNASDLLGPEYSLVAINIQDYKLLD
jgi:hypothetical protein